MQNFEHTPTVKRKRFLINFAFFALIFALSIVLVRYALPELFPFFVAFIVTMILRPVVRFLHNKLKLSSRVLSVILVVLFYGTIGVIVIWLLVEILSFAADKATNLPSFFQNQIRPSLSPSLTRSRRCFTISTPKWRLTSTTRQIRSSPRLEARS